MLSCPSSLAQNTKPAKAILVVDASGSMYGRVPGVTKISIAKKVVSDLVKALDSSV